MVGYQELDPKNNWFLNAYKALKEMFGGDFKMGIKVFYSGLTLLLAVPTLIAIDPRIGGVITIIGCALVIFDK